MKFAKMKTGDKVEHALKKTGVHQLVKLLTGGRDCGCDKRKKQLNDWHDRRKQR